MCWCELNDIQDIPFLDTTRNTVVGIEKYAGGNQEMCWWELRNVLV